MDYKGLFSDSETKEHKAMKAYMFNLLKKNNQCQKVDIEKIFGERRPDVYLELRNSSKVAVECQHSDISPKEVRDRTKFYNNQGIYVLWILNGVKFKKRPRNMNKVSIYNHEKTLSYLYEGRVYYINAVADKIISEPYALYFAPCFEEKQYHYSFRLHYYKKKKSVVYTPINSFRLLTKKTREGYLIARFFDKNVEYNCREKMQKFLINYYNKGVKKLFSTKHPERISLSALLAPFREQFGVFLPLHLIHTKKLPVKGLKYHRDKKGYKGYKRWVLLDKIKIKRLQE